MKAKLIIVAVALILTALIFGSCTFRTCPTYAKTTAKTNRI